jgi:hypothetical protein
MKTESLNTVKMATEVLRTIANHRRRFAGFAALFVALSLGTAATKVPTIDSRAAKHVITVYKDPACGCCRKWIAYLENHGYRVDAKDAADMQEVKRSLGVPASLTACHTAVVNGYLIEGHVSAEDIDRLLSQKPTIAGLAVPGMPMGSPGMDGGQKQAYSVLSFDRNGKTHVFSRH